DDYNQDGFLDLLVGYSTESENGSPTQIELFTGSGGGLKTGIVVRAFPTTDLGYRFVAPIRGCVPAP
ncbi:MAG: hypothetical protein ACPG4T_03570, partial [Nannocystaceae bacterium]